MPEIANKYGPKCRRLLVEVTRLSVYFLLVILLLDYADKLRAFYCSEVYFGQDGYYHLYTPLAFLIGQYIRIDFYSTFVLLLLSISLRFCWKYIIGVLYIFTVLIQRAYLDSFLISNLSLYITCYTNIAVIITILYLGVKQQFIKGQR